jgi:hypothetical protein
MVLLYAGVRYVISFKPGIGQFPEKGGRSEFGSQTGAPKVQWPLISPPALWD